MKKNLHTPKYTQLPNQDGGSKSQGFLRGKFWYLRFYKKHTEIFPIFYPSIKKDKGT